MSRGLDRAPASLQHPPKFSDLSADLQGVRSETLFPDECLHRIGKSDASELAPAVVGQVVAVFEFQQQPNMSRFLLLALEIPQKARHPEVQDENPLILHLSEEVFAVTCGAGERFSHQMLLKTLQGGALEKTSMTIDELPDGLAQGGGAEILAEDFDVGKFGHGGSCWKNPEVTHSACLGAISGLESGTLEEPTPKGYPPPG